jgi:hypothetical protein
VAHTTSTGICTGSPTRTRTGDRENTCRLDTLLGAEPVELRATSAEEEDTPARRRTADAVTKGRNRGRCRGGRPPKRREAEPI